MKTNFDLHLVLKLLSFCLDCCGNWEVSRADIITLNVFFFNEETDHLVCHGKLLRVPCRNLIPCFSASIQE